MSRSATALRRSTVVPAAWQTTVPTMGRFALNIIQFISTHGWWFKCHTRNALGWATGADISDAQRKYAHALDKCPTYCSHVACWRFDCLICFTNSHLTISAPSQTKTIEMGRSKAHGYAAQSKESCSAVRIGTQNQPPILYTRAHTHTEISGRKRGDPGAHYLRTDIYSVLFCFVLFGLLMPYNNSIYYNLEAEKNSSIKMWKECESKCTIQYGN